MHMIKSLHSSQLLDLKVNVSLLQAMKVHGDVDSRVHIFVATALEDVWWLALALRSTVFSPGKIPYSFYRRLRGPQKKSGLEGMQKNVHPQPSGIEPGSSSP